MEKNKKFKLIALMVMLITAFTLVSCGDNDDFDTEDYSNFLTGSWNTDEVDVVTHQPTGNPDSYVWTFRKDGTGVWVDKGGDNSTHIPNIVNEFRYTVKGYGEDTGLWYDFCVDFVFLDSNGETAWTERLCFTKTGKNRCSAYTEGKTLCFLLKR